MGSLFLRIMAILAEKTRRLASKRDIFSRGVRFGEKTLGSARCAESHDDFGEDVHAADLGGHPEFRPLLHPDHGRLAADPAPLARGEFWGKDQDEFDVRSLLHSGTGVKEHPIGADVTGLGLKVRPLGRTHTGGNAGCDSTAGTALGLGFRGWQKCALTLHQGCHSGY